MPLKNSMSKLSVHLVAWNGAKYIPYLFESLRAQTYKDWELLAIDNGSKDETADLIEQEFKNFPVPARLIRNKENNGFAGGHNQAVREMRVPPTLPPPTSGGGMRRGAPEYIQLLNQDMYLAPDYFERVVAMMDANPEAGAGQGMLLKWDFNTNTYTDVVDTMGLKVLRNRRVVDWKTGEHNAPQPPLTLRGGGVEVFGVSGALPIYRRKAIEDVMFEGQMFDEDLFSYKEDVDLAFRLRSAGWKACVSLEARAWHDRTAAGPREKSDRSMLKNRKTKSAFVNYHSYKNHLTVLLKNEHRANFAKDWPWICFYELKKLFYLALFDWSTLKGLKEVKKLWPQTKKKRNVIMKNYKVKPEEMRAWFV